MKTPMILLLTNDPQLEEAVAEVLSKIGGVGHLTSHAGDALQIVCGVGRDLDVAVIDFAYGTHGMTLLGAINACRKNLPVIVIIHDDAEHVEALAYANGAVACFLKPVDTRKISAAIERCCRPERQLALVA